MNTDKSIVVTVSDEALPSIKKLASLLASSGMRVAQVMPISGVITGTCSSAKMKLIKQVQGVTSVEEEVKVTIPAPDSNVL